MTGSSAANGREHLDRDSPEVRGSDSYGQILKATVAIGGASVVNIVFGMVRAKAVAVLLGPAGVGLFGVFNSILDLAQGVAGFGVASSGVRSIAQAGDEATMARTARALSIVSILLGILGAIMLASAAGIVSQVSFGTTAQDGAIGLLALALFFRVVSAGQSAVIQGARRVADLGRATIYSGLLATIATIAIVYACGTEGVAPALLAGACLSMLPTWFYAARIRPKRGVAGWRLPSEEAGELLKLGFAFMVSGLLTFGTAYIVRTLVVQRFGFEAAGLYQAAWALGGLYAGVVLQAMGADFFPRLSAAFDDDALTNRLVNEQARVSLLVAGPGIAATLTLAPAIVAIFYSGEFVPAADVLRWICLGMMLRVVAWPVGYIILARSLRRLFVATEIAATAVHLGLAYVLIGPLGIEGAGVAFFVLYLWHSILITVVARFVCGFRWTSENRRLGIVYVGLVGMVFVLCAVLPTWPATIVGVSVTIAMTWGSVRHLIPMLRQAGWSLSRIPLPLRRLRFGSA